MRSISYHLATLLIATGLFCLGVVTFTPAELESKRDLNVEIPAAIMETSTPDSASKDIGSKVFAPAWDQGELHASPFFRHGAVLVGGGGARM